MNIKKAKNIFDKLINIIKIYLNKNKKEMNENENNFSKYMEEIKLDKEKLDCNFRPR